VWNIQVHSLVVMNQTYIISVNGYVILLYCRPSIYSIYDEIKIKTVLNSSFSKFNF
jgi:hypothetical protein